MAAFSDAFATPPVTRGRAVNLPSAPRSGVAFGEGGVDVWADTVAGGVDEAADVDGVAPGSKERPASSGPFDRM